jgi:hypothetical protein
MIPLFSLRRLTWSLLGVPIWLTATNAALPVAGAAESPRPAAKPATDERLQNSLDNALLRDLGIPAKPEGAPPRASKPTEMPADGPADLDPLRREQLGAGEDLGQPSEDLLVTIGRRMRLAESLIGRQVTSQETQSVQQQVIRDLEQLIVELNKQCQGAQSGASSPAKPGAKPDGKSRAGSGENTGASQPAKESTDRTEGTASDREELARLQILLRQVWGHLPPKIRDQMQSGLIEEFLPKYERLIEEYYSRLAEEGTR